MELTEAPDKFEASLDPLENLHSNVHELLFQHFQPEDSFRASLVSRQWNERTEKSLKCWEKLELYINDTKMYETFSENFKSSRKYQKLILETDVNDELISVLGGRKWSSVKMYLGLVCELVQMKEILKILEPTVETLHLEFLNVSSSPSNSAETQSHEDTTKLKYPKLKDLMLVDCYGLSLEAVTGDCKTLEKLNVSPNSCDPAVNDGSFFSSLDKVLEDNPELKEFSYIVHNKAAPFPILSTLNYRFKLKYLFFNSQGGWVDVEDRFLNFLKSQANNLEDLKLHSCTGLDVLKTVLEMPKLMKFNLYLGHELLNELIADWISVHFNQNRAIEDFFIWFPFDLNDNVTEFLVKFLVKLFQSIPNCQLLHVSRLNGAALRSLAEYCPKIKELKVVDLQVRNTDELPDLPDIEFFIFHPLHINRTVKDQIRAKPEEARTRLEKLILQAYEGN